MKWKIKGIYENKSCGGMIFPLGQKVVEMDTL